ncbi:MAG: sulfatase, partial [Lentisphaerae bacterium]|nr:sulfatase [Lentisphaerota bacterium]
MKAIMVMFDSLNRHMLPPYGCDWVKAPNFERLASKTVTFDNSFIGSMACMPARRELHTGRYNFLHRSWGPIEPFDDSTPQILSQNGIYTHLVSDHYHYWEEGGCNYHTRYNSWEFSRGQEGDHWQPALGVKEMPESLNPRVAPSFGRQDFVNRKFMADEADQPQPVTFANGLKFLRDHHQEDNWFLQIETFDPHEPYFAPERFKQLYPHEYKGPLFDWPSYGPTQVESDALRHVRLEYAALVSMCDHYLGKVLDMMDQHDLWRDTMLIINTDHGFLLGEHGFCGK